MPRNAKVTFQDLYRQRNECAGFKFTTMQYKRTFTYNIFVLNAHELFNIAEIICDPDSDFFISTTNKEAGVQAHREMHRRMHNFVASAKSLVDHTRVFINENYKNTPVFSEYDKLIKEVAQNYVVSFIHDLRNYMLHKGLPPSKMFWEAKPADKKNIFTCNTGVFYDAGELLLWEKWSASSLKYIKSHNKDIHIKDFCAEYLNIISELHSRLNSILENFHASDIEELAAINKEISLHNSTFESNDSKSVLVNTSFELISENKELDEMGLKLFKQIIEIEHNSNSKKEFPSERPIVATLTDDKILKAPQIWCDDKSGRSVFLFIFYFEKSYGLTKDAYSYVYKIISKVLAKNEIATKVSKDFLESTIVLWLEKKFISKTTQELSDAIYQGIKQVIQPIEVIIPIAELEIETAFEFGQINIIPFSSKKFDQIEQLGENTQDNQQPEVALFFQDMRQKMQGLAAVSMKVVAERNLAEQIAEDLAQSAVSLLRFFSPTAENPWLICPINLFGSEYIPTSNIIVIGENSFNYTQALKQKNIIHWQVSANQLEVLKTRGLLRVGRLLSSATLNNFEQTVRASLLLYGTGVAQAKPVDRLVYSLAALESALVKHSMEPTELSVSERCGLLLSDKKEEQKKISQLVRKAYRQRREMSRYLLTPNEQHIYEACSIFVFSIMSLMIDNLDNFEKHTDFIQDVDSQKTY